VSQVQNIRSHETDVVSEQPDTENFVVKQSLLGGRIEGQWSTEEVALA